MSDKQRKRERAQARRGARKVEAAPASVGYGNPPKHGQFKPGQSGNPSGRPKAKAGVNDILERSLMTLVEINVGGRSRRVSALEAMLMRERNKALQGDLRSTRFLVELAEKRGLGGPANGSSEADAQEAAIVDAALRRKLDAALGEDEGDEGEGEKPKRSREKRPPVRIHRAPD